MTNTLRLVGGEFKRLVSYKLLARSLFTGVIWILVFLFISKEDAGDVAPMLMFVDVSIVLMMLLGASFYLERQENTINSMMVLPVSLGQILLSKVISSLVLTLVTVAITCASVYFIHAVSFNYALLLLFVILAAAAHAAIGLTLALSGKSLGSMLIMVIVYVLIFAVPSILFAVNIIDARYEWLVIISPSHAARALFFSVVSGEYELGKTLFSCIYLLVLGFQVSYHVMTTRIYKVLQEFYRADNFNMASAMAVVLLVLAVLSLWMKDRAVKRGRYSSAQTGAGNQDRVRLGGLRIPIFLVSAAVLLFSSVMPILAILLTALTRAYGLPPLPGNLTLANFTEVFSLSLVKRAILNSFKLSIAASAIVVAIGTAVSYILVRTDLKIKKALDITTATPYAIPGTIVALAMILAFSRSLFGVTLYNTFWIILIAYVARYLFFAVRTISAAITRASPSLEEAARISGAGWLRSVRDVLLPQIKSSAISSWILVFAHMISELTVSILLWSVGNETVAVAVFNLQETGSITASCALAVILLIVTMGSYLLAERLAGFRQSAAGRLPDNTGGTL